MNIHERTHRAEKVAAVLDHLDAIRIAKGWSDEDVLNLVGLFGDEAWAQVAREANQKPLSPASRAEVRRRLRNRLVVV